ncbi:MAG: phasin family protein [Alphaproteobacteria bacterium]|nr:phasin family protein [Alphaproteobacteria bacterium]
MARTGSEPAFPTVDVSKFFESFKIPGLEMNGVMDGQRKTVQAMIEAQRIAAEAYQGVFRRQVELAQEAMEDLTAAMKEVMSQDSPSDAATKHLEFVRKSIESSFANLREIAEMTTGAHTEAFKVMQARIGETAGKAVKEAKEAPAPKAANTTQARAAS